jgi:transcriptional regulator with XRE-family HTH domain
MAQSPTVRRLQLGRDLRRLRELAGVTREASSAELECDVSKISKVENGRMTLALAEVKALLRLYRVEEDEAERILSIAREARKRSTHRVPEWVRAYVGLEAEAAEIKDFQIDLVPGLLQTEAYTRAITRAADPTRDPAEVERLVAIRRERQARLQGDDPPQLWVIIDEAAIRRVVGGPEVMAEQLDRLLELSKLRTVSVQVLPFAVGAHAAMGTAFTIFRLPEPPNGGVVALEGLWSAEYVDREPQVAAYSVVFDQLCASARDARDTLGLIEKARGDLR